MIEAVIGLLLNMAAIVAIGYLIHLGWNLV